MANCTSRGPPSPSNTTCRNIEVENERPHEATEPVSPARVARGLTELWSPRVVAELDDSYVKVAKVQGSLTWHSHDDEDELFFILKGSLKIEMEDRTVVLREGETFVVPKGVR